MISIDAAYHFPKSNRIMMDPLRLPAQIISGIGFIGAGVILRKSNDVISGLTTSAMIWGAAGLGVAIGAGFYKEAFVSLIFILISVEFLPWIVGKIGPNRLQEKEIRVRMSLNDKDKLTDILKEMKAKKSGFIPSGSMICAIMNFRSWKRKSWFIRNGMSPMSITISKRSTASSA